MPNGIQINNRRVSIQDIINETAQPKSPFEQSTFNFIKSWLGGVTEFEFQTSGSTGVPKKHLFTREQIRNSGRRTIDTLHMREEDTVLVCLDTAYIAGKMLLVRALEGGLNIVAVEPSSDPFQTTDQHIDFVSLVPLQLQSILGNSTSHKRLNNLKTVLVGGAPMSPSLIDSVRQVDGVVYATYGMTETLSNIALRKVNGQSPDVHFQCMQGVEIGLDARGCLTVNDSVTNINVATNDVAELTTPAQFRVLGRIDDVINSGGLKVHPEEIESIIEIDLRKAGLSNNFIISSVPDDRLGQQLVLLVEGKTFMEDRALLELSSRNIDPYLRPKSVYRLEKFEYSGNGKINRRRTADLIPKSRA